MKFEELSKKLKATLELEDSPVGVKLIKVGEEQALTHRVFQENLAQQYPEQ